MKILWITPIFPYPPFSGGQTRAYNLIKNLAKKNEITLFSFLRPGRVQGPKNQMTKFCAKIETFPGRKIWSIRNLLLAGFSHLPFTITHFYGDLKVKETLDKELSSQRYDLVHFESFYTSSYLRQDMGVPTVLGNENIEYLVYQRFSQQKNLLLKLPLNYEIWKMKKYEQSAWQKADLNLAVSEVDSHEVEKITGKKCVVIPNGVDVDHFQRFKLKSGSKKFKSPVLLFVGDFRYFTNRDALTFLVKEIWPRIKKEIPGIKLWLVGKNPNSQVESFASQQIIVDSNVDDIRQAYAAADLLLAPLRIASGTNIKILEAMAAGLPVVTTSVSIEGIRANKGKEVIVADKKDEIAHQVINLIRNKNQRQKISYAAKIVVAKFYDWSKITQKLETAYRELVNEHKN